MKGTRNDVTGVLCALFAETLDRTGVAAGDNFFELGGHPLQAVMLLDRVRDTLGSEVSVSTFFAAPTPELLAGHLDSLGTAAGMDVVLPLRAGGPHPLFCVHPASGLGWGYAGLLAHLPPHLPVYALQSPALTARDRFSTTVAEVAADYVDRVLAIQPRGPHHLLGWSLGGMLAHEMATLLCEQGERVGLLALLDSHPAGSMYYTRPDGIGHLLDQRSEPGGDTPSLLAGLRRQGGMMAALSDDELHAVLRSLLVSRGLLAEFRPRRFDGDLVLFLAAAEPNAADEASWTPHVTGRVTTHRLNATHHAMMRPRALQTIGSRLAEELAAVAR